MDILLQVIQVLTFYIPYLEVTNNLWRGHVFTIPKNCTSRTAKISDDGDARASWLQHLYSSVLLAGCQYHPAWWFFPLKAVMVGTIASHVKKSAEGWSQIIGSLSSPTSFGHESPKKNFEMPTTPKMRFGSFFHSTVVGISFTVGCLSYRLVGG